RSPGGFPPSLTSEHAHHFGAGGDWPPAPVFSIGRNSAKKSLLVLLDLRLLGLGVSLVVADVAPLLRRIHVFHEPEPAIVGPTVEVDLRLFFAVHLVHEVV